MDARLRTIVRYFQSCPDRKSADLEGLARGLHPHVFALEVSAGGDSVPMLSFAHIGGRLERELRRSALKESSGPVTPEILGTAALAALHDCATTKTAIWLREAATTSDQSGRVIEMAAVFLEPNVICGGILYSPTAWFFAESPVVKVRPLAGKPPSPGIPPSLKSVPRP
ncbi:MAG: hypothetical protein KGO02_20180 [Alphaproteobacteria bacterium]|nr:hypothetical protein [Alphaproteobacteria bacterium]